VKTNRENPTPALRHDSNTLFQHSKVRKYMFILNYLASVSVQALDLREEWDGPMWALAITSSLRAFSPFF
jgi:hypothetical protein